jgi:AraC family cel operon transcriptional repressor
MESDAVWLAALSAGELFDANDQTLPEIHYVPRDFVDVVAFVSGSAIEIVQPAGQPRPSRRLLSAGDLVVYRPGDDVTIIPEEPAPRALWVSFPLIDWRSLATTSRIPDAGLGTRAAPIARFDPEDRAVIRPFVEAAHALALGPTPLDLIRFWLEVAPLLFPREVTVAGPVVAPFWLIAAIEEMRSEENLKGGVARLRELAHVSPPHLGATIRRYYSTTPSALVLKMRLDHAAALLSGTEERIGSVGYRCGFGSFAYFSTCFRREYQLTPREYRASQRATSAPRDSGPPPRARSGQAAASSRAV